MTPLTIRPYMPPDEDALVALWAACGLVVPQNDPRKDIARKMKVKPGWLLIGELDGALIASCMAGYEGHRGWINYLAVHPAHQRRGYARELMQKAEELLRQARCPKINLQVRSTNMAVIRFYEDLGFLEDKVVSFGKRLERDDGATGRRA